jgi:hypothetical protein
MIRSERTREKSRSCVTVGRSVDRRCARRLKGIGYLKLGADLRVHQADFAA